MTTPAPRTPDQVAADETDFDAFDAWQRRNEAAAAPLCERDGIDHDTYGGEREWQCGRAGAVTLPSGRLMCEDHAGELGYGPKQEEYGFDPDDGLNPTPDVTEEGPEA
jgi:hypothetical protein